MAERKASSALHRPLVGVELVLGGQKSGKSRRAEELAAAWLRGPAVNGWPREAWLVATAHAGDPDMAERIRRHQADRALRVPGMQTAEEPLALADTLRTLAAPHRLVVVDCLTLWLTNWLMPLPAENSEQNTASPIDFEEEFASFIEVLGDVQGAVVLVSNEIGLGVIPLGREVRQFVDALGTLNQRAAQAADRVVLMAAGLPLALKAPSDASTPDTGART